MCASMRLPFSAVIFITFVSGNLAQDVNFTFPTNFLFGTATASYQIEGAWNVSDKGENVWDWYTHNKPERIVNGDNGDIACDSYHKYKEDVAIMKELGFDTYRFSISWSRIFPTGFANKISQDGINYYKNLTDELLSNGIRPMVTLYHWDHPQVLEELGGWTNEEMVNWFGDYARVVFRELGPKVKIFTTLNEPRAFCEQSYGLAQKAPGKNISGIGEYLCIHNAIKAHARAYHIYDNEFRPTQNGTIGVVLHFKHFYPKHSNDNTSAEIAFQFNMGLFAHPIFSEEGDYPSIVKELVAEKSLTQGFPRSRLPEFSPEWINYIRGSADYIGVNHYTSNIVEPGSVGVVPSLLSDRGLLASFNPQWDSTASTWLKIAPEGFGDLLRKIKTEYNNPTIYITENGMSDLGNSSDYQRIRYFHDYLKEMLIAIFRDGVNVKGYLLWSFLDNYEWEMGYSERFGIVEVDFKDPDRPRKAKLSAQWWKTVLRSRQLQPAFVESSDKT